MTNKSNFNETSFLIYYGDMFSDIELTELEKKFKAQKIKLTPSNQNGKITASISDFELQVFLTLSQITISEILTGTITNASWEVIKSTLILLKNKCTNKKITKYNSKDDFKEIEIKVGLKVAIDRNTKLNIEINGSNDEKVSNSLDSLLTIIKKHPIESEHKLGYYLDYDELKDTWNKTDILEEIRKKNKRI